MELAQQKRTQLDPEVLRYIEQMEASVSETAERHAALSLRYEQLLEEYRLEVYKRFARSSEKETNQQELFEETEQTVAAEEEQTTTIGSHERKKPGRKPIDEHLPRVNILHDIAEGERHCACGHELERFSEEVSERIQVIPEQMYVERHIRPKYACKYCEGSGDEQKPAVRIAPAPASMIPGSIVTAGLLAFVLVNKFVDHLPFYRQEARFERLGMHLSRQDMSNWAMAAAKKLEPLIELYRQRIRGGPVMQMDETPVQVLDEPERKNTTKSYMWLARGGPAGAPVCLYHYEPTRGLVYPAEFLKDYTGYLQADGYEVYDRVAAAEPGITLVGCWAHARRKFHEAVTASKKAGAAREGLERIRKLYRIEEDLRAGQLEPEQFTARRREHAEPVLESLRNWLANKSETVVPSSLLGKAVGYTLSQWEKLARYLDHPELTPDNNAAENAIRPFVLGRKNWLFSGSPRGADASCALYSIIETGKMNGLNPFAYLHYIFTRAPLIADSTEWEELLPENLNIQEVNKAFLATVRWI